MDIAVKYGFSSQESFTRAFVKAFQVIPSAYRKSPGPIPLAIRAEVFSPYHYVMKERGRMKEVQVQEAEIKVEKAPWSFDDSLEISKVYILQIRLYRSGFHMLQGFIVNDSRPDAT